MSGIDIERLRICYGNYVALDDIDISVAAGEFLVLLGPSGCGKSTLLNAVAGLIDTTSGRIRIAGRDVTGREPKDRGIAMVFQSYALYPRMSVRGNLAFGLKVARLPRAEIERRVSQVAEMLQITPLLRRKPSELSGGQRQRVAIGRALVRQSRILLFDEPLSNLDAQLRAELRHEIKQLHRSLGATIVYVTHDQIEALTLADRVAVLKAGVMQQLDAPQTVYDRPANRFVAGFIGAPAMNFLHGAMTLDGGPGVRCGALRVGMETYPFAVRPEHGMPVELGIRPEQANIDPEGDVAATVELAEPLGADTLLWCRVADARLFVRVEAAHRARMGDQLKLRFPAERLSLFRVPDGARL